MLALISVDGARLRAFIERIEKLNEEKSAIADDLKDVYGELKSVGFDPKIVRKIVALRRQDKQKRDEEAEILELYKTALGAFFDAPLGGAAGDDDD